MKNNPYLIALLLATSVVAGRKVHSAEKPPTPVKVKTLELISSMSGARYLASITARTQVALAFKVSGYVEALHQVRGVDGRSRNVQEGDLIAQGTVLARVRQSDYAVKVGQAESQSSQALTNLNTSKAQLIEAQSSIAASRAHSPCFL